MSVANILVSALRGVSATVTVVYTHAKKTLTTFDKPNKHEVFSEVLVYKMQYFESYI